MDLLLHWFLVLAWLGIKGMCKGSKQLNLTCRIFLISVTCEEEQPKSSVPEWDGALVTNRNTFSLVKNHQYQTLGYFSPASELNYSSSSFVDNICCFFSKMEEGFKAGKHSYLPGFVTCIGSLLLKELKLKQVFDFFFPCIAFSRS